jgi:hypothetical protein
VTERAASGADSHGRSRPPARERGLELLPEEHRTQVSSRQVCGLAARANRCSLNGAAAECALGSSALAGSDSTSADVGWAGPCTPRPCSAAGLPCDSRRARALVRSSCGAPGPVDLDQQWIPMMATSGRTSRNSYAAAPSDHRANIIEYLLQDVCIRAMSALHNRAQQ